MIKEAATIVEITLEEFMDSLKKYVNYYQSQNLKVEIQYQYHEKNGNIYSALILGRSKEDE